MSEAAGDAYRLAISLTEPTTHVIYADDDLINVEGRRHSPHFKPDWNSEMFRHFDYVSDSAIFRLSALNLPSLAASPFQDALKLSQRDGGEIVHLPKVLHHRRSRKAPTLPLPPIQPDPASELPSVSVLVPTRNRLDLLETCLEGLKATRYPGSCEIIIIDNGSDDPATIEYLANIDPGFARVIPFAGAFNFAAINNSAAREAKGKLLCFLNNDIEITDPSWLAIMAQQAVREEVGAVGAQLLYPDGRIQHAGVVLGIGGAAAHAHRLLQPSKTGYFHRHKLPQFVSAVTAACLVVERAKFEAVGGFDEEHFAVSFNDVDLCLKLRAKGWKSLYEPRARLVHHESISRGLDRDALGAARQAREVANLQEKWRTQLASGGEGEGAHNPDPYHHPELSRLSEQFVVRL
ncbi:glycosyltransferase [Erythrobacter sp. NAP1]|uniref:glycosyltransferase family 2 protein n=1 Tax=Erythrobacter sp. NAP1 TaxID=237727 RepID=UPI0002F4365F|nr:glycosyltransferase family 2 protein [Erythrobacter sp. NAP1]